MAEEKRKFSPPAVGGSSLLVIFAVLCLTVFAMLSLSTVLADERLRSASAEAIENYYAADFEAERVLSEIRSGERPEGVEFKDENIVSYTCPISDTQVLAVEIELTQEGYRITRWQAVYTADWTPDNKINVWSGKES